LVKYRINSKYGTLHSAIYRFYQGVSPLLKKNIEKPNESQNLIFNRNHIQKDYLVRYSHLHKAATSAEVFPYSKILECINVYADIKLKKIASVDDGCDWSLQPFNIQSMTKSYFPLCEFHKLRLMNSKPTMNYIK
jgi:hypothetical protein